MNDSTNHHQVDETSPADGPDPQVEPQFDPADWTPTIEGAFFDYLEQTIGSRDSAAWTQRAEELIRGRVGALEEQLRGLITNSMDAANARFTLLAVAAYDVLEPVLGSAEAAATVDNCLNSPLRQQILDGTQTMLDEATDPFTVLVAVSKEREETYFGPSFSFERPVDDDDAYVLDVRRCLFHEILVGAGRPELQPILCRFDLNWVEAIQPSRHHLRFVRPVTFASGNTCRMIFARQERLPHSVVES